MAKFVPPSISQPQSIRPTKGPTEIVASAPPVSKAALAGHVFGTILIFMGLLNLTEGKDPDLGVMAEAAQGIKQTTGMAYVAAGVNTCMIATLCQHTKRKE